MINAVHILFLDRGLKEPSLKLIKPQTAGVRVHTRWGYQLTKEAQERTTTPKTTKRKTTQLISPKLEIFISSVN